MSVILFAMACALLAFVWLTFEKDRARKTQYLEPDDPARYTHCIQCDLEGGESVSGFELTENGKVLARFPLVTWHTLTDAGKVEVVFRGIPIRIEAKWGGVQVHLYRAGERIGTFGQTGYALAKKEMEFQSEPYSISRPDKQSSDLEIRSGERTLALLAFHPSIQRNRSRRIYFPAAPDPWLEAMICMIGVFCVPRFGHLEGQPAKTSLPPRRSR